MWAMTYQSGQARLAGNEPGHGGVQNNREPVTTLLFSSKYERSVPTRKGRSGYLHGAVVVS
jgi:hypothetical protein